MSQVTFGSGLFSGFDIASVVDALVEASRGTANRLETRVQSLQGQQSGLQVLEASLLSLSVSSQLLGSRSQFESISSSNSDPAQVQAVAGNDAVPGSYQFQSIRKSSAHQLLSRGFTNSHTQAVGEGQVVIATGGRVGTSTRLDALNGGDGISRGSIRITDRSGQSADIDLSNAFTVDEVVEAINQNGTISVFASVSGGRFVLTDLSGDTAADLKVAEVGGGSTAADLGLLKSVGSDTLQGADVYELTADFTLDQLNDGNLVHRVAGVPDLRVVAGDGTQFDVTLDDAQSLADVVDAINGHEDNGGLVVASLADGRLQLVDTSGGPGSPTVQDINSSSVVRALGLDVIADGSTLTGRKLLAGMNSVLLHNLNGGQGIGQTGQISVTDRAGNTAVLDLTGAESLDEVLTAINSAVTGGGTKLQLDARVNDAGNGILITDTSGQAGNLVIADVGGSTLAADLNIDADTAGDQVGSGSLALRYVNQATTLADYAPDGKAVSEGKFRIIDSAGNQADIAVTAGTKTVGDVIQRINSASGISVRAELNATGDGFVIIDEAGGPDPLRIEELVENGSSGTTAADLRLLGEAELIGGVSQVTSRRATVIDVQQGDTLDKLVEQINAGNGIAQASLFNDGSAFNSTRLTLTSATSGVAGRLVVDTGGLDLGLSTVGHGRDALLQVGTGAAKFLVSSGTNTFNDAVQGIDVTVLQPGDAPAVVNVARDTARPLNALKDFAAKYNSLVDTAAQLTKFDFEANTKGVLQGSNVVLRITSRLQSFINRRVGAPGDPYRSLADVGVRLAGDGKLTIDETKLKAAINDNPDALTEMFLGETIPTEGSTPLSLLRDGQGIQLGTLKVTDRGGASAEIDLSGAQTLDDVLAAINGAGVAVTAKLENSRIVITDNSGGDGTLRIEEVAGGKVAGDLGLLKSSNTSTLTGNTLERNTHGLFEHLKSTLDSMTDPFTGSFALERNALQTSQDSLTARIGQLDEMLALKRERLTRQFINMDAILGQLNSQQLAISRISQLNIQPVGKGILS